MTPSEPGTGELGFRVLRDYWRRGLGKEGARTLIDYAFRELDVSRIWAGTVTTNVASRMTLAAAGMAQTDEPLADILTYEITRLEWLTRFN